MYTDSNRHTIPSDPKMVTVARPNGQSPRSNGRLTIFPHASLPPGTNPFHSSVSCSMTCSSCESIGETGSRPVYVDETESAAKLILLYAASPTAIHRLTNAPPCATQQYESHMNAP